jgi:peptidoglycan hydrolase FlgJ
MEMLPFDPSIAMAQSSINGLSKAQDMAKNAMSEEKAREAAQEFEAVFLTQILETMYAGVEPDSLTGGGNAEKLFRSMINEKTAQSMAKNGGIGLADAVYRQIIRLQEM